MTKPYQRPNHEEEDFSSVATEECFGEFGLIPRKSALQELDVKVNVGSVLNMRFSYVTQADLSDISFDNTLLGGSPTECCSVIIQLYWNFFEAVLSLAYR